VTFKIGDRVEWISQSAGIQKRKEGRVVNVIPHRGSPYGENGEGQVRNPGACRNHESYVVRVKGRGLYWPRVSALRPVRDPTEGTP